VHLLGFHCKNKLQFYVLINYASFRSQPCGRPLWSIRSLLSWSRQMPINYCLSQQARYSTFSSQHSALLCYKPVTNTIKSQSRPTPLAARSKEWFLVCLLELQVRIPPWAWMSVCCECCVFSGRGRCEEPIPRPEEPYRLCVCVCVCVCVFVFVCLFVCVWLSVSQSVIRCNNNLLHLQWVGRKGSTKGGRKKTRSIILDG
jgi:hypothetical protein